MIHRYCHELCSKDNKKDTLYHAGDMMFLFRNAFIKGRSYISSGSGGVGENKDEKDCIKMAGERLLKHLCKLWNHSSKCCISEYDQIEVYIYIYIFNVHTYMLFFRVIVPAIFVCFRNSFVPAKVRSINYSLFRLSLSLSLSLWSSYRI